MFDLNLHHDQDQDQDQDVFSPQLQYSCSSSSSLSNPTFLMTAGLLSGSCDFPLESHKQEAKKSETGCDHSPPTCTLVNEQVESDDKGLKFKIRRENENTSSAKWMSSKMRMMRKMITSDNGSTVVDHPPTTKLEDHQGISSPDNSSNSSSGNNSSSVRVCVDCNTTKTPLWRSGPTGPKSLCNACGIRQRKARRAMAAAVNGETSINPPPMKKVIKHKNKRSSQPDHNDAPKFKKRCKINIKNNSPSISNRKTISFEEYLRMSLISTSGFEQVFPQDEKEAAILLMALSYGLVH